MPLVFGRGKHVVIHGDNHGDEHDGVIEEMQLNPRKYELQDTARNRLAPKVVVKHGLPEQEQVFDVMPELDHKRNSPPRAARPRKALAKHPQTNKHDNGITVVEALRFDQPWIPEPKNAVGLWPRPAQHPDLISLRQVLAPVNEH